MSGQMTEEQRSDKFWELVSGAQRLQPKKWERLEDFQSWLESWGGRIKKGRNKRKGFVVRPFVAKGERMSYEVPLEFVDRCLILDALP